RAPTAAPGAGAGWWIGGEPIGSWSCARSVFRFDVQRPTYGPVPTPPGAGSKLNKRNISWPGTWPPAARTTPEPGPAGCATDSVRVEVTTTLNAAWDEELVYACEVAVALSTVIAEMGAVEGIVTVTANDAVA